MSRTIKKQDAHVPVDPAWTSVGAAFDVNKPRIMPQGPSHAVKPKVAPDVLEAIQRRVGTLDTVLAAHGITRETYEKGLAARRPPTAAEQVLGSPARERWVNSELRQATIESSVAFTKQGRSGKEIDEICKTGRFGDLATVYLKGFCSTAIAYSPVSFGVIALTIPLALVLAPIPLILVTFGITIFATIKHTLHAVEAAGKVNASLDKSRRPDGSVRSPSSKICPPKTLRSATINRVKSEGFRTGIRAVFVDSSNLALLLLQNLKVATGFVNVFGNILGPLTAAISPPTTAAMQVASQYFGGKKNGCTFAPLVGIKVDPSSGAIKFDETSQAANVAHLSKSAPVRALDTVGGLLGLYREQFPRVLREEKKKGMTAAKVFEGCFGGTGASFLTTGVSVGAAIPGSAIASSIIGYVATLMGSAGNITNIATGAHVQEFSKPYQVLKEILEGKGEQTKATPNKNTAVLKDTPPTPDKNVTDRVPEGVAESTATQFSNRPRQVGPAPQSKGIQIGGG